MSSAGGIYTAIDRIEAIGGDCVQVFTQSPRMWKPTAHTPEAIERFKTRRAEAGIGGVVCHALYLCNLGATDDAIYEKSIATIRDDARDGEPDRGRLRDLPRRLAPRRRLRCLARARRPRRSSRSSTATTGDTWLAMENSAGPGGTIGRSIGELAALLDALDRHPRLGICLDSCHLYASGYDVGRSRRRRRARRRGRRDDRPRPALRAPHQRQRHPARLEPRPAREHPRRRDRRGARRVPRPPCVPGAQLLTWRCRARATAPTRPSSRRSASCTRAGSARGR